MAESRWAYGVTTCKARFETLLPQTLISLHNAGFTKPTVFADDCYDATKLALELAARSPALVGLNVVARGRALNTVGNWVLALWELLIRNPTADRFAMFQDDFVMCAGVREYLDRCKWSERGYLNLYTFPQNQAIAKPGWFEAKECANGPLYHGKLGNKGLGAVALCFTRDAVVDLLSSRDIVTRPMDAMWPTKKLDGCIVTSLNKAGWREWCHDPSLVQHTGEVSSIGNNTHPLATSFKGENWNVLQGT